MPFRAVSNSGLEFLLELWILYMGLEIAVCHVPPPYPVPECGNGMNKDLCKHLCCNAMKLTKFQRGN